MNKKTTRIAGWALGLSMAVAGIGAAVVGAPYIVGDNDPIMVKATGGDSVGDSINSHTGIRDGYSYTISYGDYYLTTTVSSDYGAVSDDESDAGVFLFESAGATNTWYMSFDDEGTKTYFKPGTSNGKVVTSTSSDGMALTASTNSSKIRLSIESGNNTWTLEKNNNSTRCGGYKNTQTDISSMTVVSTGSVSVASVSLNKSETSIEVGNTETLTATVLPANATNKNVNWTSSNTGIATVENGVVTGISGGSATITATTVDGGLTATCLVNVTGTATPVTGVSLNKTSTSITIGETETLTATVAPAEATTKTVSWTSSDETVATVANNGVVTAKKKGVATITVTTADGGFTATCVVTVNNIAVTSVGLNKHETTLYGVESETLTATVLPVDATVKTVSWTSSNTSVATVSAGTVTAKAFGTTTIRAKANDDNSIYDECVVNVSKFVGMTDTGDTLDRALTGRPGDEKTPTYADWSAKKSNSSAVYAGNSAGGNDSIQLRSNNSNSGIVTTTSGGYARKVTVAWNSNSAADRTIDIYGKDSAYSAATDLYGDNKGTKLGSIVNGTSTVLELFKPFQYIGIRSNSGALYLDSVEIEWSASYAAFSDIEVTDTFINSYMHLDHTANDGSCKNSGWYLAAKAAYNSLTANQKKIILESNSVYKTISEVDWTYADVKARYEAWAVANNDKAPYDGNDTIVTKINPAMNGSTIGGIQNEQSALIITATLGGTLLATGGYFLLFRKRRKED